MANFKNMKDNLNSKDMKDNITDLFAGSPDDFFVVGHGILTGMNIAFDHRKLSGAKPDIATILTQLGIDQSPMISLSKLTTSRDGTVWNRLQSIEDFQALELLLACSDACGFIHNDSDTIGRNIREIGDSDSILISQLARSLISNDDRWLHLIRKTVVNKMYFFTDQDSIRTFANEGQKSGQAPFCKHK